MPFQLRLLSDSSTLGASRSRSHDDFDSSDSETALGSPLRSRSFVGSLIPSDSSLPTTSQDPPIPSRSRSPSPRQSLDHPLLPSNATYGSDSDEPLSPPIFRGRKRRRRWWAVDSRSWWSLSTSTSRRHRRKRETKCHRLWKRIFIFLILFALFALFLTRLLMYILNPDKEPLPWREYCSLPPRLKNPPFLFPKPGPFVLDPSPSPPDFPPPDFDNYPPVGILLGVFSIDHAVERRMLIRSTWARHPNSRNGAGEGDGGNSTSRTIVRFVLGRPSSQWERRIQLEMETYNDLIILPITENMNDGKTHAFFTWAASNAWVPPIPKSQKPYPVTYSNMTVIPPALAFHDPRTSESSSPWVRPDFVAKCDDDAFVMLAELEARLRVEMADASYSSSFEATPPQQSTEAPMSEVNDRRSLDDPLIYWGYLVKNQFMAGELYSLSWSLVDWVSSDSTIMSMAKGTEDKLTAKWMAKHPRAESVRWASDHCWIYDHPRSGTVYSHGFLFPSEVFRARREYASFVQSLLYPTAYSPTHSALASPIRTMGAAIDDYSTLYQILSRSTVSKFGSSYKSPLPNLTPLQSVEALIEGSAVSQLNDNAGLGGAEAAWRQRENRTQRFDGKRIGGTVVVHFVKRNEWYLETALALLGGDEVMEDEIREESVLDQQHEHVYWTP